MTVVNVVAGAVIGAVMAPLVYLLATLLLTGPNRIPRTPLTLAALLASCFAAGVAITTSTSSTVGDTNFTGIATVVAYGLFAVGVLAAALVDVTERRIPNRITYPLIAIGVLGLPWLTQPVTGWALLAPLLGGAPRPRSSGCSTPCSPIRAWAMSNSPSRWAPGWHTWACSRGSPVCWSGNY